MKIYLITLLTVLFLFGLVFVYVFFDIKNQTSNEVKANNYSECAKQRSSTVIADYPNNKCTTKDGEVFIETPTNFNHQDSSRSSTNSAE